MLRNRGMAGKKNVCCMELLHADTTQLDIKAFFQVYSDLGYGFLERIYQCSMAITARGRAPLGAGRSGRDLKSGHWILAWKVRR